jgi:hypothetical protein
MTYTITTGQLKSGRYWARLDTETHYSHAEGDDAWTAAVNAVQEAQFIIEDNPKERTK